MQYLAIICIILQKMQYFLNFAVFYNCFHYFAICWRRWDFPSLTVVDGCFHFSFFDFRFSFSRFSDFIEASREKTIMFAIFPNISQYFAIVRNIFTIFFAKYLKILQIIAYNLQKMQYFFNFCNNLIYCPLFCNILAIFSNI